MGVLGLPLLVIAPGVFDLGVGGITAGVLGIDVDVEGAGVLGSEDGGTPRVFTIGAATVFDFNVVAAGSRDLDGTKETGLDELGRGVGVLELDGVL